MLEVSRFYGIVVKIFYADHNPPHVHAEYGNYEVLVNINTLAILGGSLPARALDLVTEWASLHQPELRVAGCNRLGRSNLFRESSPVA